MDSINLTEYNSKTIYESLPVTSDNVTWNVGILTNEEFETKEAELELLQNVTLYKGDGVIITATFHALINKKKYISKSVYDRDSTILYYYLYVYSS